MPKDKRSFFERITGTISVADDRDIETEYQEEPTPKTRPQTPTWQEEEEEEEGELAVDVYQTGSEIIIQSMVAGVKPEDLQISITREMVTIKGRRERSGNVSPEDYFQKELYWGSFTRTILLPAEIETEESEAIEKHGLLTLRLPKIDKEKSAKLKVRSVQ
ncbi:MAG: Hsp20/alpha crystallin family protein [Candidatus Vogelbacteria bacterium]|nr:Hsp20/alpha crystallin family protein [Candidatus Vogelbacteria bacterium]